MKERRRKEIIATEKIIFHLIDMVLKYKKNAITITYISATTCT